MIVDSAAGKVRSSLITRTPSTFGRQSSSTIRSNGKRVAYAQVLAGRVLGGVAEQAQVHVQSCINAI